MALELLTPTPIKPAGGDDGVERDGMGRPRIVIDCEVCETTGKVPSEKVAGRLNKCGRCKGEGTRKVSYTRVTTYIDVLDNKEGLLPWTGRSVLMGVARDPSLIEGVIEKDPEDDKDWLNRRAEVAKVAGGSEEKADRGTRYHSWSEAADRGEDLPNALSMDEWLDLQSYVEATVAFHIERIEQLVINDELQVAGTPDRVSKVREGHVLITPDGEEIGPTELLITDLKTGRLDYDVLKMAMQLAIYSRSKVYKKDTGERLDAGPINTKWGVIMHLAPGSNQTDLYWADLTLGWEAVQLAGLVRSMRTRGRRALVSFEDATETNGMLIAA